MLILVFIRKDLKKLVNATGVYLALLDYKRKPVKEDDDETGHIDPSKQMVVRYIAWCQDHSFLKGKFLEVNTGVTYNLFAPKTEQSANPEGGQEQQEPAVFSRFERLPCRLRVHR